MNRIASIELNFECARLYAISSSDMIVVGGPIVSLSAEYFNDFTDAKVFTEYTEKDSTPLLTGQERLRTTTRARPRARTMVQQPNG